MDLNKVDKMILRGCLKIVLVLFTPEALVSWVVFLLKSRTVEFRAVLKACSPRPLPSACPFHRRQTTAPKRGQTPGSQPASCLASSNSRGCSEFSGAQKVMQGGRTRSGTPSGRAPNRGRLPQGPAALQRRRLQLHIRAIPLVLKTPHLHWCLGPVPDANKT